MNKEKKKKKRLQSYEMKFIIFLLTFVVLIWSLSNQIMNPLKMLNIGIRFKFVCLARISRSIKRFYDYYYIIIIIFNEKSQT